MFEICETFLNQTVEDKILKIAGYQFEKKIVKIASGLIKLMGVELSYTSQSILTTNNDMISNRPTSGPFD